MKNKYEKLEKVIEKIVERKLEDFYQLPDNFDRVVADVYPSQYGLNLHITFLMKRPFDKTDSDFFHDFFRFSGVKSKIKTALGDMFDAGISSSNSTIESYERTKWWYDEKKSSVE